MPPARITVVAALAVLGAACHSVRQTAIDPALAECMPAGASILAGVNLERVRASPLRHQFPPTAVAFLDSLGAAQSALIASDGGNYLVLTRGDFKQAPLGSTLLGPGLSALGSPDWVRAANAPHNPDGPRNALIPHAEPVAASADIWMAVAGNANLPVSGNGENLNRLLHDTEYATLSVRLNDGVSIELVGMCGGPEPARHLEETVRSFVMLGAASTARQPAVSGLLRRIQVTRADRAVHVTLAAQAAELETVLKLAVP